MLKNKKAFTLIELLVAIAIIGMLATISVLALSNARAKSRDAKRAGDMKQIQTALELFFNDNNRYPTVEEWNTGKIYSTSTGVTSTYMQIIPNAPTPADGDCTNNQNAVNYTPNSDGSSYTISFCLGSPTGILTPGPKCLTPSGILNVDCVARFVVSLGGSGSQIAKSIIQSSDGGYVVAGSTDANEGDVYVTKLRNDGSLDTSFGSNGVIIFGGAGNQYANSIVQINDGSYIVVGYTSVGSRAYIAKLNNNGSLDTSFDSDGIMSIGSGGATSVAKTSDGGFIITAESNPHDIYAAKFTVNGSLDILFGTEDLMGERDGTFYLYDDTYEATANSVWQTADGGYVIAGNTNDLNGDAYILKIKSDGSPDNNPGSFYTKQAGGANGYQSASSIRQTADGGYVFVGYNGNSYGDYMYIVKLNANGSIANVKNLVDGLGYSAFSTSDGGYVVAGYIFANGSDAYMVKLKSDNSYDPNFSTNGSLIIGDSNEQKIHSIIQTTDGGYVAAGVNNGDMYVVKMDDEGVYQSIAD